MSTLAVMATNDIGIRIRDLRRGLHLTQEKLAEDAGVDRTWLSLLERGEMDEPGALKLARLAQALCVSCDFLLSGIHPSTTDAELSRLRRLERRLGEFLTERTSGDHADHNS